MNDELLAPAIGAGLIDELTLSEYQNLKTEIMP